MLTDLLKWGGKRPGTSGADPTRPGNGEDVVVASKALPKFLTALGQQSSPVLIDFGPVIGSNVEFFGERLGCKLFIEDLIGEVDRHTRAATLPDLPSTFEKRFRHGDASADGILCWDIFDFLDKSAGQALARQVVRMLRPGGAVMGFFCTSGVEGATFTKYEIVDDLTLRYRRHSGVGGHRRAIQNRDIIRMFEGLLVSDQFLLKNNTREILLRAR